MRSMSPDCTADDSTSEPPAPTATAPARRNSPTLSTVTPPVALAAFAAATITKDDPLATGLAAMRVGWAAFILPFVFVATPAILMEASWSAILLNLALAAVGIIAVTAGIVGFWTRRLPGLLRLAFVSLGAFALPLGFLPAAEVLHIPAALAAVLLAVAMRATASHITQRTETGRRES